VTSGILLLDKPVGPTSHDAVARVRRAAGLRRVGHAGTLDPLADGLLVLGLGPAARFLEYLVGLDKTYETTVRLGQATTTYDAEGEVTAENPVERVGGATLTAALGAFRGPIRQRVPSHSAVKRDGRPLYESARRGEMIDLPQRDVVIHALDLLAFDPPLVTLRVACSSGTYIRSLAHDLGAALGCGGHVAALRRTAVGVFSVDGAVPLDTLTPESVAAALLPPAAAVAHLPRLEVDESEATRLSLGQRLAAPPDALAGNAAAFGPDGRFLGVVEVDGDVIRPRKMLSATDL
jgi:tRNA pseudouridine55 synthase